MTDCRISFFFTLAFFLACLVVTGCGRMGKTLVDLSKLQAEIIKEYGDKGVNVNLNNSNVLTVTFLNSPLNAKGQQERAARAAQTAAFVSRHYPAINQIDKIWVGFVRSETRFIVMHYSESLDFFGFDKNGRPLIGREHELTTHNSNTDIRPRAVYSPSEKQTNVAITSLQLEGNVYQGLAVSPHFTVPGDATGIRRSSSFPKSVSFDFGSYSEKSMFPGEPRITVLADGKVVFETSAQFSTSKSPEGKFSEYLQLQIPYSAFRRMTGGRTLTLRIGDREYEFTGEQLQAMREMTQYVKD